MSGKEDRSEDRLLGVDRPITRRDFLNGIAVGATVAVGGALHAAAPKIAAQDAPGYYPLLLTGLRGNGATGRRTPLRRLR
jgi:spermidine dehydrogenase